MVHEDPDDVGQGRHELLLTTGNAGTRIACGKIVQAWTAETRSLATWQVMGKRVVPNCCSSNLDH
jgi:hypothetical protein